MSSAVEIQMRQEEANWQLRPFQAAFIRWSNRQMRRFPWWFVDRSMRKRPITDDMAQMVEDLERAGS